MEMKSREAYLARIEKLNKEIKAQHELLDALAKEVDRLTAALEEAYHEDDQASYKKID